MALIPTSLLAGGALTNEQVHHLLGRQVARGMLGVLDDAQMEIGPLSSNYYSFTFSVKALTVSGRRDVFVKIPKVDMRGLVPSILPITPEDRRMAQEEESSLTLLSQKWEGGDLKVCWANLCGTVPEYNAIVTERIFADEAFMFFRRLDLRRRFGFRQDAQRLQALMARLGATLGRFHQTNVRAKIFRLSEALPKFEFYCHELEKTTGSPWPERILQKLHSMGDAQFMATEVPTLKGIDIRNVLIDADDRLYLLDPGRIKFTHREADLARFMMTYRVLYWGSKLLLLFRQPDPKAEASFLDAYYASAPSPCPQLLDLFLLKEQLKHWHTALDSLRRLPWSPAIKGLVARIYVNPFYTRQVAAKFQSLMK